MEAQKQFNENIFNATSEYETEMAKVQKRLSNSIEQITNTNSHSDEGKMVSKSR